MNHIFTSLKEALKRKLYDQQLLARVLLNEITILLGEKDILQWQLKQSILYIYSSNPQYNITLFTKKKEFLTMLNKKLVKSWYEFILKDIRITAKRDPIQWQEEGEEKRYGIEE